MEESLSNSIEWSEILENHFKHIGEKSQGYSILHRSCEARFDRCATKIDLPVIVLSTIAGTMSIGSTSIFPVEMEKQASMGIGMLSLFVSVLNTIGTYFSYSKRAEAHRISHLAYAKLYRDLEIEMSLPRSERMSPKDLLKFTKSTYERLHEVSPLVPNDIIKKFSKKFKKYTNISKPSEANGLMEIVIYDETDIKSKGSGGSLPISDTIDGFLDEMKTDI